ncbi:MAG TPA: phosphatase PAP2 family protein [Tepidisphaeraceae bacterium]|nr:phosphatase PAP2 family protein [Tepidisphaeraceae bacterium]
MSLEPNEFPNAPTGGPPDEDWARWEATFMSARPVLPDVAIERIEAAIQRELAQRPRARWYRNPLIVLLPVWVAAFVLALFLDRSAAEWVQAAPPLNRGSWVAWAMKLPGYYPVTLGVAVLLFLFHRQKLRAALPPILAGPIVGVVYSLIKWIVGRHRPVMGIEPFHFEPFGSGLIGLFHPERGLSFPSGHAAMAFATATCLSLVLPRWTVVFVLIATAVGFERVLENAHYLSDVVAGAGLGVLAGIMATRIVRGWGGGTPRDFPIEPGTTE